MRRGPRYYSVRLALADDRTVEIGVQANTRSAAVSRGYARGRHAGLDLIGAVTVKAIPESEHDRLNAEAGIG